MGDPVMRLLGATVCLAVSAAIVVGALWLLNRAAGTDWAAPLGVVFAATGIYLAARWTTAPEIDRRPRHPSEGTAEGGRWEQV